ncbi:MAG: hypothetical protein ACWA49_03520 [Ruegeria sp.]
MTLTSITISVLIYAALFATGYALFGRRSDTPDTGVDDPRTIPPRRDGADMIAKEVSK